MNKKTPKISVCIITYNQEKYIKECLESIISQQGNFLLEIVIRDDCSTDTTALLINNIISKNTSKNIIIKNLTAEENLGANRNMLKVLENCTGDYIAFCEGDDYWCDDYKLQKQLEAAEANPNIDLFVHPAFFHYPNKQLKKVYRKINKKIFFEQKEIFTCDGKLAPTASYFIRKSAIKNLPTWFSDATVGDLYIEIYTGKNGIYVVNEYLSVYRVKAENSWSIENSKLDEQALKNTILHFKDLETRLNFIENDFNHIKDSVEYRRNINNFSILRLFLLLKDKNGVKQIRKNIIDNKSRLSVKQKIKLLLSYSQLLSKLIFCYKKN